MSYTNLYVCVNMFLISDGVTMWACEMSFCVVAVVIQAIVMSLWCQGHADKEFTLFHVEVGV